jgi:hypothetical protein
MHWNSISNIETGKTDNLASRRIIKEAIDAGHRKEFGCPFGWVEESQVEKSLSLDKKSLLQFVKDSELVDRIDRTIVAASETRAMPADSFVEPYLERLFRIGIRTLPELEAELRRREAVLTIFGVCCFEDPCLRLPFVPQGIGIAALHVMCLLDRGGVEEVAKYLGQESFDKKRNPGERARHLKKAYDKARKLSARA